MRLAHLVGRVVTHPDGADLPGRDGVGHQVHQAREVHPPGREVVLVHVDVVTLQPGQLWAVADPAVAAVIEQAHQAAVKDALTFIEDHALFTRTGPQGIRQVDVRGLVAAAFTHRDSRAGDPDLHTHVAVANKVQTLDGRWLSIDGRVLFKANVAASETYNTALEQHLRGDLGVRFAERPCTDPAKRPIREIVGVDPRLNQRWSTRRVHINTRRGELAIQFQHDHGRPPTAVEALHLAQQATLETRDAKHEPRSLTEQRATWLSEASAVMGGPAAVTSMVQANDESMRFVEIRSSGPVCQDDITTSTCLT
jgi:conjugative relaxase-like TrwC/TraI family protein